MSVEQNKQIIRDFVDAMSRGDAQAIADAYAPDGECWTSGKTLISGTVPAEGIYGIASQVLDVFPEKLKFTITSMTAEDDRVAIEAESDGVHVSGKHYHNQYHFLAKLRDGKIVEWKEYMDTEMVTEVLCGGARP